MVYKHFIAKFSLSRTLYAVRPLALLQSPLPSLHATPLKIRCILTAWCPMLGF